MKITDTEFFADTVKVILENEDELTHGDTAPRIEMRMPRVGDEQSSLGFHHLATLKQARDAIGAEIQRLSRIVDLNS